MKVRVFEKFAEGKREFGLVPMKSSQDYRCVYHRFSDVGLWWVEALNNLP